MRFSTPNRWSEAECVPATHCVYVVGSSLGWRTGSAMGGGLVRNSGIDSVW